MKQEKKAHYSKERILTAALEEFSAKSYDAASLNTICNDNDISKGLIYHYFDNKDQLYLHCIKECFEKFTLFLGEEPYDFSNFQQGINQYLSRRLLFFRTYPLEGGLFFHTVLHPPNHLTQEIQDLRAGFDAQCLGYYQEGLDHSILREGVTKQSAMEYFALFQELFHRFFQQNMEETLNLDSLMQAHESQLSHILNLMLYGIVKETTK